MNRHAKASSVETALSSGASPVGLDRAFAIRRDATGFNGIGALSARARIVVLALTVAAFILLALAPLSQAKVVAGGFGTSGTLGGQFGNSPRGIAVNASGVGAPAGTVYVVDGNRIQRFSPSGTFERAWGFDVEIGGITGFEICTVAANCKAGIATPATANGGQLNNAQGVAVNQANGDVYVTESTNRRVSEFDANGNFVRTWGFDVEIGGITGFEICAVAASCKTAAAGGSGAGQFAANLGHPTVDSSNNVWVPDAGNSRIQVFGPTGSFLKIVGGDVITNGAEGTGNLASGSTAVTGLVTTKRIFEVGQTITAPSGIQAGTTITAVTATGLTLSKAANASVTGQTLTVAEGTGNVSVNEQQTIAIGGAPSGGGFNLAFGAQSTAISGTANLAFGSATLTNVNVTAGTFAVGQGITAAGLSPGTTITAVDTLNQTLTLSSPATEGATNRAIAASAITPGASAAAIQTLLEGLSTVGAGNVSVSGPAGGPWTVTFGSPRFAGADVPSLVATAALAPAGTVTVTSANPGSLEVCSIAAECRASAQGTSLGQFGAVSPTRLAFDAAGNLYSIDPGNSRVQRFDPTLSSATAFGASTFAAYTTAAPEQVVATEGGTRLVFSVNNTVSASERQLVELDPVDASVKDTSLVGSGLDNVSGLGFNGATGTLYATTTSASSPRKVLALAATPPPDPALTMDEVTIKTASTATFTGTVDPMGGLVTCNFQYSDDQVNWTNVPVPGCDSLSPSGGAQAVSANATGLLPHSTYFVRISVSRPLVANSTKEGSPKSFTTDAVPPVVDNVSAISIGDTSVRLVGRIDPRNAPTKYVFEYGTTPSLGSSTPEIEIGGGSTPLVVSQLVEDLTPNTTYFFKLVATSVGGTMASPDQSFTTRSTPLPLAENRRYEMVSPPAKNGGGVDGSGQPRVSVALNGQRVGFCTDAQFGDPPPQNGGVCALAYVSRRTPAGWVTRGDLVPPYCPQNLAGNGTPAHTPTLSSGLDVATINRPEASFCPASPPLDPAAPQPASNFYRVDLTTDVFSYSLLAPSQIFSGGPTQPSVSFKPGTYVGGSDDFGHIVYESTGQQTPEASVSADVKLFDWDHGTLGLVSRAPGTNAPLAGGSRVPFRAGGGVANPVSTTGDRIFFQNPTIGECIEAGCEAYVREGGTVTHWISQQECTVACAEATAPDQFEWATPSGDKAFFLSTAKHTDDDTSAFGSDLYRYVDSATPASDPNNLALLSKDNEPADGTSADVVGIIGASNDGNTVYFGASGQIVPAGPTAAGTKIYRWDWNGGSPEVDYLATIGSRPPSGGGEAQNWSATEGQGIELGVPVNRLVTPSGDNLLIETVRSILPSADADSTRDVYRWNAAGGWSCISCQDPSLPSAGESRFDTAAPRYRGVAEQANANLSPRLSDEPRIDMTNDGQHVFFSSRDALVPADINGVEDVYEWNDGSVNLISSGIGSTPSTLVGSSESGGDVFFYTEQHLVGWDFDDSTDIYNARIDGGFPEPPPAGAPCEGEACRGAGSTPVASTGAGSAVFQGPGNQAKAATCRKGTKKVTVKGKVVCKKKKKKAGRHHKSRRHHQRASANGRAGK